jgi:hypothetical protein
MGMSVKLQVIVPIYPDPLLCQLYFRNYLKYKHQYVDRLIIIIHSIAIRNRVLKNENDEIIRKLGYDAEQYNKHIQEIDQILLDLGITNYVIKLYNDGGGHGEMFDVTINEIRDENYHTLFDEQDAYWLNDNFKDYVDELDHLDLIGGMKSRIKYLETHDQLEKFNKRFGVNHNNQLFTLHLPEFLSNRIIKQIENFSGKQGVVDVETYANEDDIKETKNVFFDTFQTLNLNIYKKTDKVKLISDLVWDVIDDVYKKKASINFDDYVVFHLGHAGAVSYMTFFELCDDEDLKQHLPVVFCPVASPRYQVRFGFLYQTLDHINGFKYVENYKKNMENASMIDTGKNVKSLLDLKEYDCNELINRIL